MTMTMLVSETAPDELASRLLRVLKTKISRTGESLRTGELLREAKVEDRRRGEDAVWYLVKRGDVVIGPDSKLRVKTARVVRKRR